MRKKIRKILSILVVLAMCVGMLPTGVVMGATSNVTSVKLGGRTLNATYPYATVTEGNVQLPTAKPVELPTNGYVLFENGVLELHGVEISYEGYCLELGSAGKLTIEVVGECIVEGTGSRGIGLILSQDTADVVTLDVKAGNTLTLKGDLYGADVYKGTLNTSEDCAGDLYFEGGTAGLALLGSCQECDLVTSGNMTFTSTGAHKYAIYSTGNRARQNFEATRLYLNAQSYSYYSISGSADMFMKADELYCQVGITNDYGTVSLEGELIWIGCNSTGGSISSNEISLKVGKEIKATANGNGVCELLANGGLINLSGEINTKLNLYGSWSSLDGIPVAVNVNEGEVLTLGEEAQLTNIARMTIEGTLIVPEGTTFVPIYYYTVGNGKICVGDINGEQLTTEVLALDGCLDFTMETSEQTYQAGEGTITWIPGEILEDDVVSGGTLILSGASVETVYNCDGDAAIILPDGTVDIVVNGNNSIVYEQSDMCAIAGMYTDIRLTGSGSLAARGSCGDILTQGTFVNDGVDFSGIIVLYSEETVVATAYGQAYLGSEVGEVAMTGMDTFTVATEAVVTVSAGEDVDLSCFWQIKTYGKIVVEEGAHLKLPSGLRLNDEGKVVGELIEWGETLDFTNVGNGEGQTPAVGAGYSWNEETKQLTLSGLRCCVYDDAVILPAGASIYVEEGSENTIICESEYDTAAIRIQAGTGDAVISGKGTLNIVSAYRGIYCDTITGDFKIQEVTLNIESQDDAIRYYGMGALVVEDDANVDAVVYYGGSGAFYLVKVGAEFIARDGANLKLKNEYGNYGIYAETIEITGKDTMADISANYSGVRADSLLVEEATLSMRTGSFGFYMDGADDCVVLSGASVDIETGGTGWFVMGGNVDINNSIVDIVAEKEAIEYTLPADLTITGGQVNLSAQYGITDRSSGDGLITIKDSDVTFDNQMAFDVGYTVDITIDSVLRIVDGCEYNLNQFGSHVITGSDIYLDGVLYVKKTTDFTDVTVSGKGVIVKSDNSGNEVTDTQGNPLNPVTDGLDLTKGVSSGDLAQDGYSWDAETKTLMLQDSYIDDEILLPTNSAVTIVVNGLCYIDVVNGQDSDVTVSGLGEDAQLKCIDSSDSMLTTTGNVLIKDVKYVGAIVNEANSVKDKATLTLNNAVVGSANVYWLTYGGMELEDSTLNVSGKFYTEKIVMNQQSKINMQCILSNLGKVSNGLNDIIDYLPLDCKTGRYYNTSTREDHNTILKQNGSVAQNITICWENRKVFEIDVEDIEEPKAAMKLDTEAFVEDARVKVTSVKWFVDGKQAEEERANYNTEYTIEIKLSPVENCTISDSVTAASVTVNGQQATMLYVDENGAMVVEYTFAKTQKAELISIEQPKAISDVKNGTAKTVTALGLPTTVQVETQLGVKQMEVVWDLENLVSGSYSPDVKDEQTFVVGGIVSLPEEIANSSDISLKVQVQVTVLKDDTVIASPEPSESEDANPEPSESEDANPEPSESEDANPEPGQSEDANPEPGSSEDVNPVPGESESPELGESESPEPGQSEDVNPNPSQSEDVNPNPSQSEDVNPNPEPSQSEDVNPEQSEDVNPEPGQSEDVNPEPGQSEDVNPNPSQSEDVNPNPSQSDKPNTPITPPEESGKPITPPDVSGGTTVTTPPAVSEEAVLGDIDGEGGIALRDAQLALRAALLLDKLDEKQQKAADVDENGVVELKDAQQILRRALLLIEEFEKAKK